MLVSANVNYAVNRSTNGGRAIIWPIATGYNDSRLVITIHAYMTMMNL